MERKVFIDCGANIGQSIETFKRYCPDWQSWMIHSFEPVKACIERLKSYQSNANFKLHPYAAWIHDGEVSLFEDQDSLRLYGSSIIETKNNVAVVGNKVPCIDISNWIDKSFQSEDIVVLKLDVEGAEYAIIDRLIETGVIEKINTLYVEFHRQKLGVLASELPTDEEVVLKIKKASSKTQVDYLNWHGLSFTNKPIEI